MAFRSEYAADSQDCSLKSLWSEFCKSRCESQQEFRSVLERVSSRVASATAKFEPRIRPAFKYAREAVKRDLARDGVVFDIEPFIVVLPEPDFLYIPCEGKGQIFVVPEDSFNWRKGSATADFFFGYFTAYHETAHAGQQKLGTTEMDKTDPSKAAVRNAIADMLPAYELNYYNPLHSSGFCNLSMPRKNGIPVFAFDGELRGRTEQALMHKSKSQLADIFVNSVYDKVFEGVPEYFQADGFPTKRFNAARKLQKIALDHRNSGKSMIGVYNHLEVSGDCVTYKPTGEKISLR